MNNILAALITAFISIAIVTTSAYVALKISEARTFERIKHVSEEVSNHKEEVNSFRNQQKCTLDEMKKEMLTNHKELMSVLRSQAEKIQKIEIFTARADERLKRIESAQNNFEGVRND